MKKLLVVVLLALSIIILVFNSCTKDFSSLSDNSFENKWINVSFNLEGRIFKKLLIHNDQLIALTENAVFKLNNFNTIWEQVGSSISYPLTDVVFKEDSLMILSSNGKVYYLNNINKWENIHNTNMGILPAYSMICFNNFLYTGSAAQHPLSFGLAKLRSNIDNTYFKMPNYNYPYSVQHLYGFDKWLFLGSTFVTEYFAWKCDGDTLYEIKNLNENGDAAGVHSFASNGDTLFVGAGHTVKMLLKNEWIDYKTKFLPIASGFSKPEKALSLLYLKNQLLIGTEFSGILEWDKHSNEWKHFEYDGIPFFISNNLKYYNNVVYLLKLNNYLYAGIGLNNYYTDKSFTQVYCLNLNK